MKVAVLGAGLMGKEVVRDLVRSEEVKTIGLADIDLEKMNDVCNMFNSQKLHAFIVDAGNREELAKFICQYDVIINALFYSHNTLVAKTAIEVGVNSVDLGGHIGHVTDRILLLKKAARSAKVTIIPDLGVAPGMCNILSGYGASKLDKVELIKMYVGGIPVNPEPPLEYSHVFSMEGLLDHYTDPSLVIRNGVQQVVPSLSEVEEIYFERFGLLEAFHTSGGTSTLPDSYPQLNTLEYKTIRYKGHAKKIKLLVDLNLTRKDYEVDIKGQKVNPREVLLKVLAPFVDLKGKDDAVLLRVTASGMKNGVKTTYKYEMKTYKDHSTNVTAMAQATANTISVVAQMIGNKVITKKGVYPPEQIVSGREYMKEMGKRGIIIIETVSTE